MIEGGVRLEHLPYVAESVLGLWTIAMCFSIEQRAAIRRRDNQECQMDCAQAVHCNPGSPLEVHHVIPQAYAREFGIMPDFPENGISLCRDFHQNEIHNMKVPEAKKALHERRVYWNTEHDRKLGAIAVRNTQRAKKKGWIFPSREE